MLPFFDADTFERLAHFEWLIEVLRHGFRQQVTAPLRPHYDLPQGATLLLMPAWQEGGFVGTKLVTIFPDNPKRGKPSIQGVYVLCSALDGSPLALFDARALTAWRTAAASALASTYLAGKVETLLVVGTGALAPFLARAHATVHRPRRLLVWGRNPRKAEALAQQLRAEGWPAAPAADLRAAVGQAELISCATMSTEPLVHGAWLRPGQHLDLVGSYRPHMRETDDEAVRRATVFVDTRAALEESGDLAIPLRNGSLSAKAVAADLRALCRELHPGRTRPDEITLFKSTGCAQEDLLAAAALWQRAAQAEL